MLQIADPIARAELTQVFDEFVKAEAPFTAAHVTQAMRRRGMQHGGRLRHVKHVSAWVRAAFSAGEMPGYDAVFLPEGFHLYAPAGVDYTRFNYLIPHGNWLNEPVDPAVAPVPTPTPTVGPQVAAPAPVPADSTSAPVAPVPVTHRKILRGDIADGTAVVRGWSASGYVEVPKEMLRAAKFEHGQPVMLFPGADGRVRLLAAISDGDATVQGMRLVLRLWEAVLKAVGIDRTQDVVFTYDSGVVWVA